MRRALFLAAALASSFGAARANAGEARVEARAMAEQGDAQFYAGRCDKAVPLWLRADARFHAPTLLLRVARCQALLGKVVAASASLRAIVDAPLAPDAPPAFVAAREDAGRELPKVSARIASLRIAVRPRVVSVPVTVEIDGAAAPAGAESIPIDPGAHRILVRAERATWSREVHLDDGESRTLDVALWVEPLPSVPPVQRNVGLASFGVGLTALATGVGLSVSALSTSRSLQAACGPARSTCPPGSQDAIDRTRAYSVAADATLAGGAVFVVAGAVLLTTNLHLGQEPKVRIVASPRGAALAWEL